MKFRDGSFSFDEVVRLMEVFSDDQELRNWLRSLQSMPETTRTTYLRSMVAGMRTSRERPELIAIVESLISPDTFNDAVRTVKSVNKRMCPDLPGTR